MNIIYQNELLFPEILWERPVHFYKSKAGRLLVIAGSRGMTGAALLTCEAAFRSGTGILTLAFPEELKIAYKDILPEAMTLPLPQTHSGSLSKSAKEEIIEQAKISDVVVIGPGLSENSETVQLVWEVLSEIKKSMVIDADGLKALAHGIEAIRSKKGIEAVEEYFQNIEPKIILTPHPGEAGKIIKALGFDKRNYEKASYIDKHKAAAAKIISEHLNCHTVLKGYNTVIVSQKGQIIEDKVGGPELATAGTGDVLSGMIGSFWAQNPQKAFKATATAVYLHSLAGKIAKQKFGERSVMASDVIKNLPEAIKISEE